MPDHYAARPSRLRAPPHHDAAARWARVLCVVYQQDENRDCSIGRRSATPMGLVGLIATLSMAFAVVLNVRSKAKV